jgi:outer membrane protein assembly factor BamB
MRRLFTVLIPLASLLVAACSSAAPGSEPQAREVDSHRSARPAAFTPWYTYHRTPARSGHVAQAPATPLHRAWRKKLGQVYGEPLVVGDTLIVATEGNQVFGLNARTGARRWHTGLGTPQRLSGLPCGDIDPLGVTGTPAYDPKTGSVFMAAETTGGHHTLWALNAANGHRRWHRSLDVLTHRNRKAEQQRAAVLVAGGHVLVSFGALAGDCNNYVGYITSTSTRGTGPVRHYAVPTKVGAGMWSPAGPALGRNGHVYVASANGAAAGPGYDKSNSVLELVPSTLHLVSAWAPTTWRFDDHSDQGLGSTSPVAVPSLHRMVVGSKRGRIYLLPERFHGVGSGITHLDGCSTFGGPAIKGSVMVQPCLFENRIRLLHVGSRSLRWGWTHQGVYGSPVIAGSRVYLTDRSSGDLVVLRLSNGHLVQRIHAGPATHFPSETVSGGMVFVPTLNGVTAFRG